MLFVGGTIVGVQWRLVGVLASLLMKVGILLGERDDGEHARALNVVGVGRWSHATTRDLRYMKADVVVVLTRARVAAETVYLHVLARCRVGAPGSARELQILENAECVRKERDVAAAAGGVLRTRGEAGVWRSTHTNEMRGEGGG